MQNDRNIFLSSFIIFFKLYIIKCSPFSYCLLIFSFLGTGSRNVADRVRQSEAMSKADALFIVQDKGNLGESALQVIQGSGIVYEKLQDGEIQPFFILNPEKIFQGKKVPHSKKERHDKALDENARELTETLQLKTPLFSWNIYPREFLETLYESSHETANLFPSNILSFLSQWREISSHQRVSVLEKCQQKLKKIVKETSGGNLLCDEVKETIQKMLESLLMSKEEDEVVDVEEEMKKMKEKEMEKEKEREIRHRLLNLVRGPSDLRLFDENHKRAQEVNQISAHYMMLIWFKPERQHLNLPPTLFDTLFGDNFQQVSLKKLNFVC